MTNAEIHEVVLEAIERVEAEQVETDGEWIDKYEMPYIGDDWDY